MSKSIDHIKLTGDKTKEYSLAMKLFTCLFYAIASSSLTFVNKSIYIKFGFRSPLNVLMPSPKLTAPPESMPMQHHHLLLYDVLEDSVP